MKGELPAQEVMPKLIDVVDHTEGFAFGGGVTFFSVVESRRLA